MWYERIRCVQVDRATPVGLHATSADPWDTIPDPAVDAGPFPPRTAASLPPVLPPLAGYPQDPA